MSSTDAWAQDRMVPGAPANGCWTLGQYRSDGTGAMAPFALLVLELRDGRISESVAFIGYGARFPEFGLPPVS